MRLLNWDRIFAALLMVVLVGLVRAEDAKEVVVASAKELKGIKAKKITWRKDGAKMVLIPANPSGTGIKVVEEAVMKTIRNGGLLYELF